MTNITLRRPWRTPATSLFDRDLLGMPMRRFFDLASTPLTAEAVGVAPAVDIAETEMEFICTAELPGLTDKEIEVSFEAGELKLKGEKRSDHEMGKNGSRFHVVERTYGAFERTFAFPTEIDATKVSAEFKNGILTVRLPKATNGKPKNRVIPIIAK